MVESIFRVSPSTHILVVDDSSPDHTWKIVREMQSWYPNLHLLKQSHKTGLGPAYLTGFVYAIKHRYDRIIQMDCDFSHDPSLIPLLIERSQTTELVIGSRYVSNGKVIGWNKKRYLLSWLGNLYAKTLISNQIKDWTSGYCCWHRTLLEQMGLTTNDHPNGYAFQISLKNQALCSANPSIIELPIVFKERQAGETKMSGGIINEALITVLRLRLENKKRSNRRHSRD